MPRINPHVGLFVAIAVSMVALFGWLRSDMARMEERLKDGQTALVDRVAKIEIGQAKIEGEIKGFLAFVRGSASTEPGQTPREPAPSR